MMKRKVLCGLLSGVMLLTYSGSALAASDSTSGSVNGMSCYGTLNVSTSKVTATTKSVPANSSYIYARADAYMYPDGKQQIVSRSDSSYEGYMEVSATAPNTYGSIHHGRGYHTVNSLSMSTYAIN